MKSQETNSWLKLAKDATEHGVGCVQYYQKNSRRKTLMSL